jgi:predicted double-glycine peptidase
MTRCITLILLLVCSQIKAYNLISSARIHNTVQSWKALRDQEIEKQDLDESCGSAALATILRFYYGIEVYEKDILKIVNDIANDNTASFSDLRKAATEFGFNAIGLSIDFDTLKNIEIPALLYLKYRDNDHFSVLKGISNTHVSLADPSWGNRTFTVHQFKELWQLKDTLKGRALVIVPNGHTTTNNNFFKSPVVSSLSTLPLTLR